MEGSCHRREGIPFRDVLGRRLPCGWRPGMVGEEKSRSYCGEMGNEDKIGDGEGMCLTGIRVEGILRCSGDPEE